MKKHGGKIPPGVERCVVPAAPDAWITALENFGTMSFGDVASYAIRFARDGFPMHPMMQEFIKKNEENYKRWPGEQEGVPAEGPPAGGGRGVPAAGSRQDDAVHGGPGEARGAQGQQGRLQGGARRVLQGRHRAHDHEVHREGRRPDALRGFRGLPREVRADRARALQRHRAARLRAVVAGPGAADGAQHPEGLQPEGDGAQLAAVRARGDRGVQARLRRPPPPFRRSALRQGADQGAAVGPLRRSTAAR